MSLSFDPLRASPASVILPSDATLAMTVASLGGPTTIDVTYSLDGTVVSFRDIGGGLAKTLTRTGVPVAPAPGGTLVSTPVHVVLDAGATPPGVFAVLATVTEAGGADAFQATCWVGVSGAHGTFELVTQAASGVAKAPKGTKKGKHGKHKA